MELGNGTVAVVTGAASGIGLALADAFAAAGCSLVLADVQADALEAAEQRIAATGVDTLAVVTDVSKARPGRGAGGGRRSSASGTSTCCATTPAWRALGDPWFGGDRVVGMGDRRQLLGCRARRAGVPPPPDRLRVGARRQHGVDRRPVSRRSRRPTTPASTPWSRSTEGLYNSMTTAGLPVGVSCLCPGWVRTGIIDSTRNWPSELGAPRHARRRRPRSSGKPRRAGDRRGDATGSGRRPGDRAPFARTGTGCSRTPSSWRWPSNASTASPSRSIRSPAASRCRACRLRNRSSPR